MSWVGFENFGNAFAPLADAQLKAAYQDYQAQKDLAALQQQQIQTQVQEQQAAQLYGYDSPRVQRQQLDPLTANYLARAAGANINAMAPQTNVVGEVKQGAREAQLYPDQQPKDMGGGRSPQGQFDEPLAQNYNPNLVQGQQEEGTVRDPKIAHMAPYLQQLAERYPGTVDEQGRIHPYIYKKVSDMMEAQAKLEAQANAIAGREVGDLFGMKQKYDSRLEEQKLENEGRLQLQGMKGSVAEKIQLLKNKGFHDTTILKVLGNENVANIREGGATQRTRIKEEASTGRTNIRAQTQKEIQGMKGDVTFSVWEKRAAIEQAKMAGRADLAQKIQEDRGLTAKELAEIKEAGATKRKEMEIKGENYREDKARAAGKYKKYPPSGRSGVPGAPRPQGYRETSEEKSLRASISNKEKMMDFMGRRDQEKARAEIETMRDRLRQLSGGGGGSVISEISGLTAQPAPKAIDPRYQAWLTKHGAQDTPKNREFFNKLPKGK